MAASASSKFYPIPDALWERIEPVLPSDKVSCHGGRPWLAMRSVVASVFYVLRTGCQWKATPSEFGSGRAIHADFQEWVRRGVFIDCGDWPSKNMTISSASTGRGKVWMAR